MTFELFTDCTVDSENDTSALESQQPHVYCKNARTKYADNAKRKSSILVALKVMFRKSSKAVCTVCYPQNGMAILIP